MIDEIGFFEDAVTAAKELANLKNQDVRVVEYTRPLSWLSALGAQSQTPIVDSKVIEKLLVPQLMYIWDGRK